MSVLRVDRVKLEAELKDDGTYAFIMSLRNLSSIEFRFALETNEEEMDHVFIGHVHLKSMRQECCDSQRVYVILEDPVPRARVTLETDEVVIHNKCERYLNRNDLEDLFGPTVNLFRNYFVTDTMRMQCNVYHFRADTDVCNACCTFSMPTRDEISAMKQKNSTTEP